MYTLQRKIDVDLSNARDCAARPFVDYQFIADKYYIDTIDG